MSRANGRTTQIGVLCDDNWHPARTILQGLEPLERLGFRFESALHASDWSAEWMDKFPAVILAKSNRIGAADPTPWLTPEVQQAFLAYVERGNGLLALHSGTVGYRGEPDFLDLIGGVFLGHPEPCPVELICEAGELSGGPEALRFTVYDEHYRVELVGSGNEVFMKALSEHGEQPAGWRRRRGDGRVCALAPGHFPKVWQQQDYQTILTNALNWCVGPAFRSEGHARRI
jgi:type 1 glutamine amidotransferase